MKRRYVMLSPLLLILICSAPAHEHERETEQVLVTVNPNLFAPGQDISHAIAGAELLVMTDVPNPNLSGTFVLEYLPSVYAQPVAASCTLGDGLPCALGGNLALGYSPTTVPATLPILWGEEDDAAFCLQFGVASCQTTLDPPVLRVNFDVPTNYVTAAIGFFPADTSVIEAFEAFDSSGQLVARCEALPPSYVTPAGCATVIVSDPDVGTGWATFTISRPTADISFVLIGGEANNRPVAQVQFRSPVALQLQGLLRKVRDLRRLGRSLEYKVMFAEAYYDARDIREACEQLTVFEHEVKAQADKHISDLTALQLLSTSIAIGNALSCHAPQ